MTENNDASALTKAVISTPLRQALIDEGIDEESVVQVFSEILHDEAAPAAVRLNCVKTLIGWLGIVNENKQLDMTITHRVTAALEDLEARRQRRLAQRNGHNPPNLLE